MSCSIFCPDSTDGFRLKGSGCPMLASDSKLWILFSIDSNHWSREKNNGAINKMTMVSGGNLSTLMIDWKLWGSTTLRISNLNMH